MFLTQFADIRNETFFPFGALSSKKIKLKVRKNLTWTKIHFITRIPGSNLEIRVVTDDVEDTSV